MDERDDLVFCVGLSKTGTTSISSALNTLGYPTIHYPPVDSKFYNNLFNEVYDVSSLTSNYRGFSDIPFSFSYKGFHESYPNCKFILTIRDPKSWIVSAQKKFNSYKDNVVHKKIRTLTYKTEVWTNEKHFINVFTEHNKEVIEYFEGNQNFLVMDICNKDGWECLCPFLGRDIPKQPFPWENKR